MPVPEAAVHENDLSSARKHEVRGARQAADVESVPEAERVDESPNDHLGFRILAPDARHIEPSLGGGEDVHHGQASAI
jgi:hypothetical protein